MHDQSTEEERFWGYVPVREPGSCWEWTASKRPDGYGQFGFHGTVRRAYQVAYALLVGEVPVGYHLHHICQNKGCVNPAHLVVLAPDEHRKEHVAALCPEGHDDFRLSKRGYRICRTCDRERQQRNRNNPSRRELERERDRDRQRRKLGTKPENYYGPYKYRTP